MTDEELKTLLLILKENTKKGIKNRNTRIENVKKENFIWAIDEVIKSLDNKECEYEQGYADGWADCLDMNT